MNTISVKRDEYLKIRLTPLEKSAIEQKALQAGLPMAVYCRKTALQQRIHYKLTEEEVRVYEMLASYHNHFKRIANLLKDKDSTFAKEVLSTASEIKEHLRKLR